MEMIQNLKCKMYDLFPALRHRNFRYFWFGQCVSLIGTWMQRIGQAWLVLTLTQSPFLLGLVGALQFAPMMIFSLFAGVYIDKFSKRKILLITQTILMIQAVILATLVATGSVQYWHILVLATLLGFVNTLDMPTRQAFMVELVGKQDLMNAIALNSSVFNAARIIGPAIAGVMMGIFGIAFCFFLNAASFLAVIYGLYRIQIQSPERKNEVKKSVIKEIKEGLHYVYDTAVLWRTVFLIAVVGIFAMNYSVLIPVLAKDLLGLQETGYGFLMSAMGIGSFVGALTVATRSKSGPRTFILYMSAFVISLLLFFIPLTKNYALTALLLGVTGFFNIAFSATANSTLQIHSSDQFRGRVMSVYALVFGGTTPIGNLFTGTVINSMGVQAGFILSGLASVTLVTVLLFFKHKETRREKRNSALVK